MYSYKPLENKLKEIRLTKFDLTNKIGISSRTNAKFSKGKIAKTPNLQTIAKYEN